MLFRSRRLFVIFFAVSAPCLGLVLGCGSSDSRLDSADDSDSRAAREQASSAPSDEQLRERLDHAIDYALNHRRLNTGDQAAWQVVHGILCFGRDLQIEHDGMLVPALDYLLKGGELKGWNMRPTPHGLLAVLESGSKTGQGHPDQWMGYMALAGVQPDEELVVGGETYHVNDLVTEAQWHMRDGLEATWPLMAFSAYLPLDARWPAEDGTEWNIERVLKMETAQNLAESACGGTHRLVGLLTAVDRYKKEHPGQELPSPWRETDDKIRASFEAAKKFQQPDGRFSTNFFTRPGRSDDIDTQMHATGHTLEFVVLAANPQELRQKWIERAVVDLLDLLDATETVNLECGGLYHAVRGLKLYRERRFGAPASSVDPSVPRLPTEAALDDNRR